MTTKTLCRSVAREIEAAREKAGITRRQMARNMRVNHSVVYRMLDPKGHNLTLKALARLAAAVGCQVEIRIVPKGKAEE